MADPKTDKPLPIRPTAPAPEANAFELGAAARSAGNKPLVDIHQPAKPAEPLAPSHPPEKIGAQARSPRPQGPKPDEPRVAAKRPKFKMGRLPRRRDPRVPQLSRMQTPQTVAMPPRAVHWGAGLPKNLGMMGNDVYGDCTIAAYYHAIQLWSSHCNRDGLTITEPDADVLALYSAACGYVPGDPATDQGGDEQTVLTYLSKVGAPTGPKGATHHRLAAFVEVNPANLDDVKRSIAACGLVYIGFNVPAYLMAAAPPPFWMLDDTGDNSIVGGHAIILTGYDDGGLDLISWGQAFRMTWKFFQRFVDEVYALVDYDWVNTKGMTPAGIPLHALEAAMTALRFGA